MIGARLYMIKELNLFKVGIYWAVISSIIMLIGALLNDTLKLSNKGIFESIFVLIIYFLANFVIFTFPAFLVNKAGEFSKNNKKNVHATKIKYFVKFKSLKEFIKIILPIALFYVVFYMIAAYFRGDIFTTTGTRLTDFGYCIGVIVTAVFFGFKDIKDVEDTQQKHDDELRELKKRYATLEEKYKKKEKCCNEMRNRGKRELAKIEKKLQLEE